MKNGSEVESSAASSFNSSESEGSDEPPDGGWGWVVMIAAFFLNFIMNGIMYSFGVFLSDYATYFDTSVANVSLATSLRSGICLLFGPVASALANRYGFRVIGISGSLIMASSILLSNFSVNIAMFQLSFGVLGGIGFSLVYVPATIGPSFYFKERRVLATGIAVSGTGIGAFTMAPFAKYLLNNLDWKNTHIVFAGLMLQGCVFSSLMRPLNARRRKVKLDTHLSKAAPTDKAVTAQWYFTQSSHHLNKHLDLQHQGLHSSANSLTPYSVKTETLQGPLYRKDIFYSGSLYNITKPSQDPGESGDSLLSISDTRENVRSCLDTLPKPVADILTEMLDLRVLKHRGMIVLCVAHLFGTVGFYTPVVFFADRASQMGISQEESALLISIMGICNTFGRAMSGIITLVPQISPLLLNNVCLALASISVLLTPLCTTFTTMALVIACFGLFISTYISLISVIICDLVGLEKLTNAFGLICLMRGVTAAAGPPLEGQLFDSTGNYDATFYMGGSCLLISTVLHFLLHHSYFKQPFKSV